MTENMYPDAEMDRLIASAAANGSTRREIADELDLTIREVVEAIKRGSQQRTWND